METPAERLALVQGLIEAAGGIVTSTTAFAEPEDPSVVVAHQVMVQTRTLTALAKVNKVLKTHQVSLTGLIPWADPEIVEGEIDESSDQ